MSSIHWSQLLQNDKEILFLGNPSLQVVLGKIIKVNINIGILYDIPKMR